MSNDLVSSPPSHGDKSATLSAESGPIDITAAVENTQVGAKVETRADAGGKSDGRMDDLKVKLGVSSSSARSSLPPLPRPAPARNTPIIPALVTAEGESDGIATAIAGNLQADEAGEIVVPDDSVIEEMPSGGMDLSSLASGDPEEATPIMGAKLNGTPMSQQAPRITGDLTDDAAALGSHLGGNEDRTQISQEIPGFQEPSPFALTESGRVPHQFPTPDTNALPTATPFSSLPPRTLLMGEKWAQPERTPGGRPKLELSILQIGLLVVGSALLGGFLNRVISPRPEPQIKVVSLPQSAPTATAEPIAVAPAAPKVETKADSKGRADAKGSPARKAPAEKSEDKRLAKVDSHPQALTSSVPAAAPKMPEKTPEKAPEAKATTPAATQAATQAEPKSEVKPAVKAEAKPVAKPAPAVKAANGKNPFEGALDDDEDDN